MLHYAGIMGVQLQPVEMIERTLPQEAVQVMQKALATMKDQPPVAVNAATRTAWFWGRVVPRGDVHKTLLNPPDVLSNKS